MEAADPWVGMRDRRIDNRLLTGPRKSLDMGNTVRTQMDEESNLWDIYLAADCLKIRSWILDQIKVIRESWISERSATNVTLHRRIQRRRSRRIAHEAE